MSYFDFFCAKIQAKDTEAIVGTCKTMCPQEEILMREKENLVHVLECEGPIVRKFVKSYSRSAADAKMALPEVLRPYHVLKETVQHLILNVTKRPDVSSGCRYDFINDRLRAVRQDMTIQRLPADECASLLEPMIRFYVFYGYLLCELPITNFDPVLNKKYLLECMKWYLTCTKEDQIDEISQMLTKLDIKYKLKCDRILVECLYLLCNLDDLSPVYRYLILPTEIQSNPSLELAYQITIANVKGNYVRVCQLMDKLCPLQFCALCVHLPVIQRRALLVSSHAYNSKSLSVPAAVVQRWLRFDSGAAARDACAHYGLPAVDGAIRFNKTDFKMDAATLQPTKCLQLQRNHDFSIDNIFTYTTPVV